MIRFGKFLELGIPTADILASLGFYLDLGFAELSVGDIRDYHYAVVTDGRIAIGLHSAGLEGPALHFVHPDLETHVQELEATGVQVIARRLGGESFNEAELAGPDDIGIRLLEAPTFPSHQMIDQPEPAIGRTSAILVGTRAPDSSAAFWESQGFVIDEDGEIARLLAPGLVLALDRQMRSGELRLAFRTADSTRLSQRLERTGIPYRAVGKRLHLTAPEGTQLEITIE